MDRAYASGASASAPTAPASPSVGYPQAGNPGSGVPATKPGPWWYHMVTEELRAVVAAAGLTPEQADVTQLLQALPAALASRPEMARSFVSNGYQKFPGGLILQWGGYTTAAAVNTFSTVVLPISFSAGFLALALTPTINSTAGVYHWSGARSLSNFTVASSTTAAGGNFIAIGV